jgi:23S rRNA pseudouridine2605 synthase
MPKKATSKPRKKKADEPELPSAEAMAPQHEPDEPELGVAGLDDREAPAPVPIAPQPDAELEAEAAGTFEQGFEERLPSEISDPVAGDAEPPQSGETGDSQQVEAELTESQEREEPPVRLERLQKILSQAGIASRRHAEELITEGRVQVNGKVVTELGSKADPERDHIRVDGKLLHGAERLRYFMLNKPRGYVTTVSDPEGRSTVMEFFKKSGERLYPVGRLDYLSEGLLLVTNDGDLANKLTKAATGVEKTYLVKVSGQPTEDELDRLREGVAIDRTRPGEGRVHTAPAAIREVRSGDNPWYEVVLTEGRNRELRKMFEEIGHHVEKIRRVGYGPLVLDLEPGQFRELDADELAKLRLAAEGKWKRPKAKEPRPQSTRRPAERRDERASRPQRDAEEKPGRSQRGQSQFSTQRREFARPPRQENRERGGERGDRPRPPQPKREWQPSERGGERYQRPGAGAVQRRETRESREWQPRRGKPAQGRQDWQREGTAPRDRRGPVRPDRRGAAPRIQGERPERSERPQGERRGFGDRPGFEDRGARRGQAPRRGPAGGQRPFQPARTERLPRAGRPAEAGEGGYRGARGPSSRPAGRNTGRPNRGPGPGRSEGNRPPFKGGSGGPGRRPSSPPRSNKPQGGRGHGGRPGSR